MKCPICKKSVNTTITNTLRAGEKRKVFLCKTCELGILDSKISAEDLKKFYATEYRAVGKPKLESVSNPEELFNIYSKFQGDRLKLLKPYLTKKAKVLEVGCSSGMFLYHIKNQAKEIVGIDFDIACAKYAAQKCNCKTYTTDIKETPLQKKYFDVIVAFQTLEHVSNPEQFIAGLKEYLAPGGVLAIEVPNLHDALAHVYDLPKHHQFFFHSSHLWYFTEKSLAKVMGLNGLRGKVFHLQDYNIQNHMHWVENDSPQKDPIPGLSLPALRFKKNVPAKTGKALTDFIIETDAKYKALLSKLKITSNILFIGK